jgi:predicted  nucleic acid-binding Zn-ribbon protein
MDQKVTQLETEVRRLKQSLNTARLEAEHWKAQAETVHLMQQNLDMARDERDEVRAELARLKAKSHGPP